MNFEIQLVAISNVYCPFSDPLVGPAAGHAYVHVRTCVHACVHAYVLSMCAHMYACVKPYQKRQDPGIYSHIY